MPAVEHWHCQGFPHQSKAPRVGAHPPTPPWVQCLFFTSVRQHLTIRNNNTKNQTHANKTFKKGKIWFYFIPIQKLHQSGKVDIFRENPDIFERLHASRVTGHILKADLSLHLWELREHSPRHKMFPFRQLLVKKGKNFQLKATPPHEKCLKEFCLSMEVFPKCVGIIGFNNLRLVNKENNRRDIQLWLSTCSEFSSSKKWLSKLVGGQGGN